MTEGKKALRKWAKGEKLSYWIIKQDPLWDGKANGNVFPNTHLKMNYRLGAFPSYSSSESFYSKKETTSLNYLSTKQSSGEGKTKICLLRHGDCA